MTNHQGTKTTPGDYYELFVGPNLGDYLTCADDVRLAFNASVTAFQLRDIIYNFYKKSDPSRLSRWPKSGDFQRYLVQREPLFQTVQSVATVFKHLHHFPESYYEVGSPGALWGLKPIGAPIELMSDWEEGGQSDVLIRRHDGSIESMTRALKTVVNSMWPNVLKSDFSLTVFADWGGT